MLKLFFIIVLLYLVYHFYIKDLFSMSHSGKGTGSFSQKKDKKINIDHVPNENKDFKGGEYIDYEEMK